MRPEDVYELTGVSDPRLRPGGRDVAYVVWSIDRDANEYRQSIWLARTDGSEPPRRFTTGKQDSQPRWSPDGSKLAFVSKRGEDKDAAAQLYVMPADGGEPLRLTDLKEGPAEPAWSPDGTQLAFSARVRDEAYKEEDEKKRAPRRFTRLQFKLDNVGWTGDRRTHLFVVPADGSAEAKQITDGDYEDGQPTWTPDGQSIAFHSARSENWDIDLIDDIYLVPAAGGDPVRLTPGDASYSSPSYSPDGKLLACKWSAGRLRLPEAHADRGRRRGHRRRPADPDRLPRPAVRPLPGSAGAALGRRGDRVRDRGRGEHPRLPRLPGRRRARARPRRRGRALRLRRARRPPRPHRHDRPEPERALRRRKAADVGRQGLRGRPGARRTGALHRGLEGRHRGRRLDRPPRRPRGREAVPGAREHPRRPLHPVRHRLLRRVPGLRGRRVRGRLLESARVVRLLRGVGPRDHGAGRARPRLGHGRLRGRAGGHGRRAGAVRLLRPGAGRRAWAAPTAAT